MQHFLETLTTESTELGQWKWVDSVSARSGYLKSFKVRWVMSEMRDRNAKFAFRKCINFELPYCRHDVAVGAGTLGNIMLLSCKLTNTRIIAIFELYINELLRYTWACLPCFRPTDSFVPWLQHHHPHSARMAERSPLMPHSSKSSTSCGENFKIFWGQSKQLARKPSRGE